MSISRRISLGTSLVLLLTGGIAQAAPERVDSTIIAFALALEQQMLADGLPSIAAAVVQNGRQAWAGGFGWADRERKIPATPRTPYRLASLSKPIAAALLLKLVEAGKLDLDAPMRDFAIHPWFEPGGGSWAHYPERYTERPLTVRQVLSHTSEAEPPGSAYKYNGNIFADLTWVIEDLTGQSYPLALRDSIFTPLKMTRTLPGQLAPWGQFVAAAIATPYACEHGELTPANYPGFGIEPDADVSPWRLEPAYRLPAATVAARKARLGEAYTPLYSVQSAAGVVSTVEDLARFDVALDEGRLLGEATRAQLYTPARGADGKLLPYALGWFVEEVDGLEVAWHFGWYPPSVSALYIKVPARRLSLILLSNCDGLSAGVAWTAEGVLASPYARLFWERLVAP